MPRMAAEILASRHPEAAALAIQVRISLLHRESFIRDDNVFKASLSGKGSADVP
jgi:hypothetical protein